MAKETMQRVPERQDRIIMNRPALLFSCMDPCVPQRLIVWFMLRQFILPARHLFDLSNAEDRVYYHKNSIFQESAADKVLISCRIKIGQQTG